MKSHLPSAHLDSAPLGWMVLSTLPGQSPRDRSLSLLSEPSLKSQKVTHLHWCNPVTWETIIHHWRMEDRTNVLPLHPLITWTILRHVLCLCFSNIRGQQSHPKSWLKHKQLNPIPGNSDLVHLKSDPGSCFADKLPGAAEAAGPDTTLWERWLLRGISSSRMSSCCP